MSVILRLGEGSWRGCKRGSLANLEVARRGQLLRSPGVVLSAGLLDQDQRRLCLHHRIRVSWVNPVLSITRQRLVPVSQGRGVVADSRDLHLIIWPGFIFRKTHQSSHYSVKRSITIDAFCPPKPTRCTWRHPPGALRPGWARSAGRTRDRAVVVDCRRHDAILDCAYQRSGRDRACCDHVATIDLMELIRVS